MHFTNGLANTGRFGTFGIGMSLVLVICLGSSAAVPALNTGNTMAATVEKRALDGDLDAQRAWADCLAQGCPGVPPDRAMACAWRIAIVAGGAPGVAAADIEHRRAACEGLSDQERARAADQARAIVKRIYGLDLILPADFFGGPARAS
jgi:hypothetical protein